MKKSRISIIGTGFTCLDIIKHNDRISYLNGGSCGNVISALAFLGANTTLIKPGYNDYINLFINDCFTSLGINIIEFEKKNQPSPRIIEEIIEYSNKINHKFYSKCPNCGKSLPKPILINKDEEYINKLISNITEYDLFYTDRTSKGISVIRNILNNQGKWVFYEPNTIRNRVAFFEGSTQSDIVKFSIEKVGFNVANQLREYVKFGNTKIIIITAGSEGLYFSIRTQDNLFTDWEKISAPKVANFMDAAGAGDWCSAGIIHYLLEIYKHSKGILDYRAIYEILNKAQKISAVSCSSEGALGLIYDSKVARKFANHEINFNIKTVKMKSFHNFENDNDCLLCLQPMDKEDIQKINFS